MRLTLGYTIALFFLIVLFSSCSKEQKAAPLYEYPDIVDYFSYSFEGKQFYLSDEPLVQKASSDETLEGSAVYTPLLSEEYNDAYIKIKFDKPFESFNDLKNKLIGKQIYFNGNNGPFPSVEMRYRYEIDDQLSDIRYSQVNPGQSYYVEVLDICCRYTDSDQAQYPRYPDMFYLVEGKFYSSMQDSLGGYSDSEGEFIIFLD